MEQNEIDRFGRMIALSAEKPTYSVGLLGVTTEHPELAVLLRLEEIERRILAIEERLGPNT